MSAVFAAALTETTAPETKLKPAVTPKLVAVSTVATKSSTASSERVSSTPLATASDVIPVRFVRDTVDVPVPAVRFIACSPDPPSATTIAPPEAAIWSAVNVTFEFTRRDSTLTNVGDPS